MTRDERVKKLRTAAAGAALNPLLPATAREAIGLLVDELLDIGRRLDELERNGKGKGDG